MRVYMDTSAWSAIYDANISPRRLSQHEILFSSCNLDEIGLASFHRARDLARFAWSVSNRRKLRDHLELTAAEQRAYVAGESPPSPYDTTDPMFSFAWTRVRTDGTPEDLRQQMQGTLTSAKQGFQTWLRGVRSRFRSLLDDESRADDWAVLLAELEAEGYIAAMLDGLLRTEGLGGFDQRVPYRDLAGTACWVQYHLALAYLVAHASRKRGRPDLGDQVDFRHACYAGIADVFVSGDERMRYVLEAMVPSRVAKVLSPTEFTDWHM